MRFEESFFQLTTNSQTKELLGVKDSLLQMWSNKFVIMQGCQIIIYIRYTKTGRNIPNEKKITQMNKNNPNE
jgi:hypothetical protein